MDVKDFIESEKSIVSFTSLYGVYTVFISIFDSDFVSRFNRWNESTGVGYSMVKIRYCLYILYPAGSDGVRINDLS